MEINEAQSIFSAAQQQVATIVVGKPMPIKLAFTALLANGHVLFEDIPGVGKTTLVQAIAKTLAMPFSRIQFTPDMLPSDVLGTSIFNRATNAFEFQRGPIFTSILLADEINRATPRTQAALLEAMGERRVTTDGHTYPLSPDFFVMATENPTDYAGTYPLPEAQLDRFMLRLSLGYPDAAAEKSLLLSPDRQTMIAALKPRLDPATLAASKKLVTTITVTDAIANYVLALVEATRTDQRIRLGISPRGGIALVSAAKAFAMLNGRSYVTPEDIQTLTIPVFGHRLIMKDPTSSSTELLTDILQRIAAPVRG